MLVIVTLAAIQQEILNEQHAIVVIHCHLIAPFVMKQLVSKAQLGVKMK